MRSFKRRSLKANSPLSSYETFILISLFETFSSNRGSLLSPLKFIGLGEAVHTLAMMMTIALRFIPTLTDETDKIMSAQKARGADIESGGLIKRLRALMPILIPLLFSSVRRAYELAEAMDCRCYSGGKGRTRMKKLTPSLRDFIALLFILALYAAIILLIIF